MYAVICYRPDLSYSISLFSKFMSNPNKTHLHAIKFIFRCLNNTTNLCLQFEKDDEKWCEIKGYVYSNYARNLDTRKSLTGFIFTTFGNVVSWKVCIQSIVILQTTDVEYIAMTETIK